MSYWRTYEDPDYYDDEQDWPDEDEYRNYQQEEEA